MQPLHCWSPYKLMPTGGRKNLHRPTSGYDKYGKIDSHIKITICPCEAQSWMGRKQCLIFFPSWANTPVFRVASARLAQWPQGCPQEQHGPSARADPLLTPPAPGTPTARTGCCRRDWTFLEGSSSLSYATDTTLKVFFWFSICISFFPRTGFTSLCFLHKQEQPGLRRGSASYRAAAEQRSSAKTGHTQPEELFLYLTQEFRGLRSIG